MLTRLYRKHSHDLNLYFLKSAKLNPKNYKAKGNHIVLLLEVPIKKLNDRMIYSYIPMSDLWLWGYWRSRYQIKSIIWACVELEITLFSGHNIEDDISQKLAIGTILPNVFKPYIDSSYSWYPEDYSGNAGPARNLETDEIPKIRNYIKEQRYNLTLKKCREEL